MNENFYYMIDPDDYFTTERALEGERILRFISSKDLSNNRIEIYEQLYAELFLMWETYDCFGLEEEINE